MASDENIVIPRHRIERIVEVLSLVSMGDFDPDKTIIKIEEEDDFGTLEESLNVFISELAAAREDNERVMQHLRASRADLEEKLRTIERQRSTIQDLSTPVIELWDDIITLPVVGIVDSERSAEMTEKLLTRIVDMRAKCVIIDLTGVDLVDSMTADHFLRMMSSARLLGAYCVMTGISPRIAQTLSQIGGIDDVRTLRTLKEGIKECFRYLRSANSGVASAKRSTRALRGGDDR